MNSDQIETYPNLIREVEVIREAVDLGKSVLGICLGAQLLAKALGGSVERNKTRCCRPALYISLRRRQVRYRLFDLANRPMGSSSTWKPIRP